MEAGGTQLSQGFDNKVIQAYEEIVRRYDDALHAIVVGRDCWRQYKGPRKASLQSTITLAWDMLDSIRRHAGVALEESRRA